jgi:hypothetical protein
MALPFPFGPMTPPEAKTAPISGPGFDPYNPFEGKGWFDPSGDPVEQIKKVEEGAVKAGEGTLPQAAGKAVGAGGSSLSTTGADWAGAIGKGFASGLSDFVKGLFAPGAPGQVPPGRVAVAWIVIITVGIIGISGLLRPGTNVVVRMAK